MSEYKLFIPGNVPSQKNSKQIFINRKTGGRFITSSKLLKAWYPKAFEAAITSALVQKEWIYPVYVSFYFFRDSMRHFDYLNLGHAILDLLVDAKILADDDMKHVIPKDWSYQVHKEIAGCMVTIEEKLTTQGMFDGNNP